MIEREREKERDLYIERKEYKQEIISDKEEKLNSKTIKKKSNLPMMIFSF